MLELRDFGAAWPPLRYQLPSMTEITIAPSATKANQARLLCPSRKNDKGRRHRTDRAAEAAAELEQRLRHAMSAARGEPRQPGRFRMEDRCAQPEHGRSGQQREVIRRMAREALEEDERGETLALDDLL